jgi:hypothetical protein
VTKPDRQKWRSMENVIQAVWPIVEKSDARARQFLADNRVATRAAA